MAATPALMTATPALAAEHDCIIRTLSAIIEPLSRILPGDCEVVLHDIDLMPNSIVALAGSLTGRSVGGPATDMLLKAAARGTLQTQVGYVGHGLDHQVLRCSTMIVRSAAGRPVAALCINCDTRVWHTVAALAATMLPEALTADAPAVPENFVGDVDELADNLLSRAIAAVNVPVALMHKRHKIAVVAELKSSGFFVLRESVERAARALDVTRFTVYNYLKELDRDAEPAEDDEPESVA